MQANTKTALTEWQAEIERAKIGTEIGPGEITIYKFAEGTGKSYDTALRHLNNMVAEGRATCRWVKLSGKRTRVFKIAKKHA